MSTNSRHGAACPDTVHIQEQAFAIEYPPLSDDGVAEDTPLFINLPSYQGPSHKHKTSARSSAIPSANFKSLPSEVDSIRDDESQIISNSGLEPDSLHSISSRIGRNKKQPAEWKTLKEDGGGNNAEYIPFSIAESTFGIDDGKISSDASFMEKRRSAEEWEQAIFITSIFLSDYEQARSPTLRSASNVSRATLFIHCCRYSFLWKIAKALAVCSLFFASCFEGNESIVLPFSLNLFFIIILSADLLMQRKLSVSNGNWTLPTLVMVTALSMEMLFVIRFPWLRGRFIISSIAKPIVLFYCSAKARNAIEAVVRILPIVSRVLALELLLILSFAAVACRLFANFESFRDLPTAWVSLFQLSTTVVNPSLWMPMYNESKQSAFFFVLFLLTITVYLHSLVLAVVFHAYIHASTTIYQRSLADREETLRLAFTSLQELDCADSTVRVVQRRNIWKTLKILRPHYSANKLDTLIGIVAPASCDVIDYHTFRTKIPQALSATVRSAPSRPNFFSHIVEITGAVVAISNFIYVILVTSQRQVHWFDRITLPAGFSITLLGLLELVARTTPCFRFRYTPTTKLSFVFDGLAALAAVVSCWGILRRKIGLDLMLTGRAIDMIRITRFHRIFRDVIRRSGELMPALVGPLALVVTTHHIFVYIGMSMSGGGIDVGKYGDLISPLYDLNNFNSYSDGLVTMFQILIVNDWHAIAAVFLHATSFHHPIFVYSYFILANLASVSVVLNCLVAFFVGAFVAKIDGKSTGDKGTPVFAPQKRVSFLSETSCKSWRPPVAALKDTAFSRAFGHSNDASSADVPEFHVFEREGFGNIMRAAGGGADTDDVDAYAKEVYDMLDLADKLSPGQFKRGYLVYCQQPKGTYSNHHRFRALAEDFLEGHQLHIILNDMHEQLLHHQNEEGTVHRVFTRDGHLLQLAASLLRRQPSISLFVSVIATR